MLEGYPDRHAQHAALHVLRISVKFFTLRIFFAIRTLSSPCCFLHAVFSMYRGKELDHLLLLVKI